MSAGAPSSTITRCSCSTAAKGAKVTRPHLLLSTTAMTSLARSNMRRFRSTSSAAGVGQPFFQG